MQEQGLDAVARPGGRGQFDVVAAGKLVFSKQSAGRFPGDGEVGRLVLPSAWIHRDA